MLPEMVEAAETVEMVTEPKTVPPTVFQNGQEPLASVGSPSEKNPQLSATSKPSKHSEEQLKIDAVMVVIDCNHVGSQLDPVKVKFLKGLVAECLNKDIPYTAALTKVDTVCKGVDDDIRNVFKSKAVANVAQRLYELLNLDMKYMLPIQNYVAKEQRDRNFDNLLLHALNRTVTLAVDQAEVETEDDDLFK